MPPVQEHGRGEAGAQRNSERLRLLHVASSYPLRRGDGTAPFMEEMLSAVSRMGHNIEVIVPRVQGLSEGVREGVDVVGFAYAPAKAQVWGYGRSIGHKRAIRPSAIAIAPVAIMAMVSKVYRRIRRKRPDLLHLHWILPQGILALLVPKTLPVVVSVHGADARLLGGPLKPVMRRILIRADAIVAASSPVLNQIERAFPKTRGKTKVIPHGASEELFSTINRDGARTRLGILPTTKLVVAVGRLVRKKGFDILIDAARALGPSVEIVILGDGPERAHLEELADAVDSSVRLVGQVGRNDVAVWIAASDVVAIPSVVASGDVDTGPVVLVEALAAGRPVVTTPVGSAVDLILDGQNGRLVESADPKALADVIQRTLEDGTNLGKEARRTFEQIGDWDRVASELVDLYKDTIANSERRQELLG